MELSEFEGRQFIPSQSYSVFKFVADEDKPDFSIYFKIEVKKVNVDINAMLLNQDEYKKWIDWFYNGYRQVTTIRERIPRPKINTIYENRNPLIEHERQLGKGAFFLVIDNSYSNIIGKVINFRIVTKWHKSTPINDLPVSKPEIILLPPEVTNVIRKANDCFVCGHFEQCSVMLRKAVEFAIRLKLLQSGIDGKLFYDSKGNELTLSHKIKLLRDKDLLSQHTAKHLEQVKWYGDLGAHSRMSFTVDDIIDAERKVRAFFTGLNLTVNSNSSP